MSKSIGKLERTVRKIKYCRKKKLTRNNLKAQLQKVIYSGDY